jgi:GNAT superfamily N-acetyltransferase
MLEDRVAAAAVAVGGEGDEQEFAIFLRGASGEVLAGVSAMVLGGCCELQAMWVDDSLRRRGLAGALVTAAEEAARTRGCSFVMIHAYDVLVHRLYERLGYRTVGVIDDCLGGGPVRWYAKDLSAAPGGP